VALVHCFLCIGQGKAEAGKIEFPREKQEIAHFYFPSMLITCSTSGIIPNAAFFLIIRCQLGNGFDQNPPGNIFAPGILPSYSDDIKKSRTGGGLSCGHHLPARSHIIHIALMLSIFS